MLTKCSIHSRSIAIIVIYYNNNDDRDNNNQTIPLTVMLTKINHLLYMDDLKVHTKSWLSNGHCKDLWW